MNKLFSLFIYESDTKKLIFQFYARIKKREMMGGAQGWTWFQCLDCLICETRAVNSPTNIFSVKEGLNNQAHVVIVGQWINTMVALEPYTNIKDFF